MPTLELLGPAWSRAFRCVWMLEELNIPYKLRGAMPMSRGVRKFNPSGKIPILLEYDNIPGDSNTIPLQEQEPSFVLFESVAINNYLGEVYGSTSGLVPPGGTRQRALYDQTVCCILSELDAQGLWLHRKHDAMGKHFGTIPDAVTAAREQFTRMNAQIATQLSPYLLGERFTAADILYVHCLDWSKGIGWQDNWPANLTPYRDLCHSRPAYQRAKALRDEGKKEQVQRFEKDVESKI